MTTDPEAQPGGAEADSGEGPTDMATLLAEGLDYRSLQRGEIIEGVVMGWDSDGALIDVGAKSEGVILRHEMQSLGGEAESRLQTGEKVLVFAAPFNGRMWVTGWEQGKYTLKQSRVLGRPGHPIGKDILTFPLKRRIERLLKKEK